MSRPTLLLTATVAPSGVVPKLYLNDPADRIADYRRALRFWSSRAELFRQVVWFENSGHLAAHQLAGEFTATVSARINPAPAYPEQLGKGYGEALILEQYSREHDDVAGYVVKCTGRLCVPNIYSVIQGLDSKPDLIVRLSQQLTYVDSRLFAVSSKLLPELAKGLKDGVDDSRSMYLEHALARRVLGLIGQGASIGFWPVPPRFQGRSGSTGHTYDSMWQQLRWPAEWALYRLKRHGAFL